MVKVKPSDLIWSHARRVTGNPVIYVCSPFAGDMKVNAAKAEIYCRYVWNQGGIPLAPHLLFPRFMDDTDQEERTAGLEMARKLLALCAEVWVFGDRISTGMAAEIAEASAKGIPIYKVDDAHVLYSEVATCKI